MEVKKAFYEVLLRKCTEALEEIEKTKVVIHEVMCQADAYRYFWMEAGYKLSLISELTKAYELHYDKTAFKEIQKDIKEQNNIGLCMVAYKELTHFEKMWKNDQKDYIATLERINKALKEKEEKPEEKEM